MVGVAIAKEKAMIKATAHTRAAVAFLFETRCWVVLGMVLDVLGCLHVYIHKICLGQRGTRYSMYIFPI